MAKFGVEIECQITTTRALRALRSIEGIQAYDVVCGYHHNRDFSYWRIECDSSVRHGCEIVSPILDTEGDGFEQIRKVVRALTAAGGRVNVTCGLHVHIAIPDLTVDWLKNIVQRYADNTSTIESFMPRSRRGTGSQGQNYCTPMTNPVRTGWFRNASTLPSLLSCFSRMYAVNVTNYSRLGTIEFRQHAGTLNAEKIQNWVTFLDSFIKASKPGLVRRATTNRGQHSGSRGTTTGQVRGAKRRKLLEMLTGDHLNTYRSVTVLCSETGYTEGSLRSTMTHLRNAGYRVRYNRYSGAFCIVSVPVETTSPPAATVPPAQAQHTMNETRAQLWAGVPSDVQAYYIERINDLA